MTLTFNRSANLVSKLLCLSFPVLLASCGGGTGPENLVAFNEQRQVATANIEFTPGVFQPASSFAQQCENPRADSDDLFGSTLAENFWIRSWTNETYLWFDEVEDVNPALFDSTEEYFQINRTTATTASGAPRDQFHFTIPTDEWIQLSQSGVVAGYGFQFALISTAPNEIVITLVEPDSPAASAGLARGDRILEVDGVDIALPTVQEADTINAGLFPDDAGEMHSFVIDPISGAENRSVDLASASIVTAPVPITTVIPTATGNVGYILFNDHIATSEQQLIDAFSTLAQQGVEDLVLDLRYNGGGFLAIASQTAFMIAGPDATNGQTFELSTFNEKHPVFNPVTGEMITPTEFIDVSVGFSTEPDAPLPSLSLPRVFVLSTIGTASASEAIINSLRGIDVEVYLFGDRTSGKPFGFFPTDNCGTTYFSIQFQAQNAKGFGDYADGFAPENLVSLGSVLLPGCAVEDDFDQPLGDPNEGLLATALAYRETGTCATTNATESQSMPSQRVSNSSQTLLRGGNPWRENMDMSLPGE